MEETKQEGSAAKAQRLLKETSTRVVIAVDGLTQEITRMREAMPNGGPLPLGFAVQLSGVTNALDAAYQSLSDTEPLLRGDAPTSQAHRSLRGKLAVALAALEHVQDHQRQEPSDLVACTLMGAADELSVAALALLGLRGLVHTAAQLGIAGKELGHV
jgi:hypothetical protein